MTEAQSPAPRRFNAWRWLLAIIPLAWVATRADWHTALASVRRVSPVAFGGALVLLSGSLLLGAIRWRCLLVGFGASAPPSLRRLLGFSLIATYFNLLPGGIAGDAVRGYEVREHVGGIATSYAVLLVDRIAGFAGLAAIASVVMLVGRPIPTMLDLRLVAAGLLVASAAAITVPVFLPRYPSILARAERVPLIGAHLARLRPMKRLGMIPVAFLLSLGTQLLTTLAMVFLVRSAHAGADFGACLHVAPLVVLLTFIPITPAAIGQREAIFVHFFGQAGVPAGPAVAASVLWFAAMLSFAAIGGVSLLLTHRARRGTSRRPVEPASPDS